jgi:hypothetical protein
MARRVQYGYERLHQERAVQKVIGYEVAVIQEESGVSVAVGFSVEEKWRGVEGETALFEFEQAE